MGQITFKKPVTLTYVNSLWVLLLFLISRLSKHGSPVKSHSAWTSPTGEASVHLPHQSHLVGGNRSEPKWNDWRDKVLTSGERRCTPGDAELERELETLTCSYSYFSCHSKPCCWNPTLISRAGLRPSSHYLFFQGFITCCLCLPGLWSGSY